MAGSDPILGVYITPKSLWASEVAPVHEGTGWLIAGLVFAVFFKVIFGPCILANSARTHWQFLPR